MMGPDHMYEIQKHNGFEPDLVKMHYNHMAVNYEGIYIRLGYPDPVQVAVMAEKHANEKGIDKKTCKVLDLGCGTGLVGNALAKRGFKNIVGFDISPKMLEQAKQKAVYARLSELDLLSLNGDELSV